MIPQDTKSPEVLGASGDFCWCMSVGIFNLLTNLCEIALHALCILVGDDFEQLFELHPDLLHLGRSAWIEEDFL